MRPERDLTKLPKWAQREINRLERDLASAYEKLNAGPDDSDTFADPYGKTTRPLGKSPTISFGVGGRRSFTARLKGELLLVSGEHGLAIYPRASNSVELKSVRL